MKFPKMGRRPATYADVVRAWQEREPLIRRLLVHREREGLLPRMNAEAGCDLVVAADQIAAEVAALAANLETLGATRDYFLTADEHTKQAGQLLAQIRAQDGLLRAHRDLFKAWGLRLPRRD
ncbi:MAG: hypothetical protein ACO1SX_24975 [Actinomycetota bacterium]